MLRTPAPQKPSCTTLLDSPLSTHGPCRTLATCASRELAQLMCRGFEGVSEGNVADVLEVLRSRTVRASGKWLVQVRHTGTESSVPADFGTGGTAYRLVLLVDQCITAECRGAAAPSHRPDAPKAHFLRRSRSAAKPRPPIL